MILAVAMALLLQAPTAAKASISGVVLNSATGEPIANVRVLLARTDAKLGPFADVVASDHPSMEIVLPAEFFEAIKNAPTGTSPADAAMFAPLQLDNVDQIIVSPTGRVAVISKSNPPQTTDSQGRFAFDGVDPGTYQLMFSASGFAKQEFGQRAFGGTGTPIVLAGGQPRNGIVMRMAAVSAVSGHIRDNMGRSIAGVPVQLFHVSYDETAHKKTQRVASTQTDDRGEYRFFFLSPGKYYLNAGHQAAQTSPVGPDQGADPFGQSYLSSNRIPQNYALTYYPNVSDVTSASAIDVQSGADVSGIDLFLPLQQTYRIRGRIVDSRTGQPPPSAYVMARPRSTDMATIVSFMGGGLAPNYKSADGSFEVANVAPGSYTLNVDLPNPQPARPVDFSSMSAAERRAFMEAQTAEQQVRPTGSANVNVANADVEGVIITIGATSSISGRFRNDGPASSTVHFDVLAVQLKSAAEGGGLGSPVKDDGTFLMKGIAPGEYHLAIAGLPAGSYLKEARLGQSDVLNAPLQLSSNESGQLDILISPNAGQIEGDAVDALGQPAPGSEVVLIPETNRSRTELFRPVTADASGHFVITAIVPGDYKLAAWDAIEPYAFFDPELMQQADQNGKSVRVTESSKQKVTVSANSAN